MRIGSLFSGYGGLDLAVSAVTGADTAWHCEWEDAPAAILAHNFPGVPNYRDVSKVDFTAVEQVDILTGGFPCQDVSLAGRRAGLKDGTRSGLWSEFARAIDEIRPRLVVIENVRGLLSAHAASQVEPCSWCLGDDDGEPALRALGAVLGDLADLGYDAEWYGVRAADAGAPHGRYRVFITAYPRGGRNGRRPVAPGNREGTWADATADRADSGAHRAPAENADESARGEWWESAPGQAAGGRSWADARRRGRAPVADADGDGFESVWRLEPVERDIDRRNGSHTAWGDYEPAIRRWEHVTGRVAPSPTVNDGKNGQHRLSAVFVEWMMGLPEGWVTAPEIGIRRNDQLKALGNGVVPQQAELALRMLFSRQASADVDVRLSA